MKKNMTSITLRISEDDLETIDFASIKENRSRTNFMITTSLEKAKQYEN